MRTNHRVVSILTAINASLPPATDPGMDYANAAKRASAIRNAMAEEKDPDVLAGLRRAYDSACYVGD